LYELFPLRHLQASQPATSFAEACTRVDQLWAQEATPEKPSLALADHCGTLLLTHDAPVDHALVLIHGFTNCPYQFQQLAQSLHQRGHNVLAVRLPAHGYADRMTTALATMRAVEVVDAVTEAVDIARGLGKEVTVIGFSFGGVLAAWFAQNRADLDRAIMISPAIGLQALPRARHRIIANVLALLPNFYQWWNPTCKADGVRPHHVYPRFATHALAVMIRLGLSVLDQAANRAPATTQLTLITNPSDPVIDHQMVAQLLQRWDAHGVMTTEHRFPTEWMLLHDLIDPLQPEAQVERVYPLLLQWIEKSLADPVATPSANAVAT